MKYLVAIALWAISATTVTANPYLVESAIYRVEVHYRDRNKLSFGTGVLLAPDKILTNCHVVKEPDGWPQVVHRETGQKFRGSKYYSLGDYDACVLVGGFIGKPVRLAEEIEEGENVWIFGFPKGLAVVGQGAVDRYIDTNKGRSILLSAFCDKGSSGGPVVNAKGQLIGLNWGVIRYQNRCLSIPVDSLRPFLAGS